MTIKRYEAHTNVDDFKADWHESKDGPMVKYEDHMALVAENAGLAAELGAIDTIHSEAVFITDEHYEQCPLEVQKMIRSLAVLQIPSYQAFLAEVQAQGVDMMAEQCESDIMLIEPEDEEFYTLMIEHAKEFATQLRKGGAA